MHEDLPVREIAKLTDSLLHRPVDNALIFAHYKQDITACLQENGFGRVGTVSSVEADGSLRFTATRHHRNVFLCLAPLAADVMDLKCLSEELCDACDAENPRTSVYYASLLLTDGGSRLRMIGPLPVKQDATWCGEDEQRAQFLPRSRRKRLDRLSAVFGAAAIFKVRWGLMPRATDRDNLPAFSVHGVFEDRHQGEGDFYALLGAAPPTHLFLLRRDDAAQRLVFSRAFFFFSERPETELLLVQRDVLADAPQMGLVELRTPGGRSFCAECLEAVLFPRVLPEGKLYRWTLSLVVEDCTRSKRNGSVAPSLLDRARADYTRKHGCEPPSEFSLSLPGMQGETTPITQQTLTASTRVSVRVLDVENVLVDGCGMLLCRALMQPENERVEVQLFVRPGAATEGLRAGDVLDCEGHLYASPDALVCSGEPTDVTESDRKDLLAQEASACRTICAAICTQEWEEFYACSHEDLRYTSRMNGTVLNDREAFIRYMTERKQIWMKQGGWSGMSMDTGTVSHGGERRACFMITCFGSRVGAGVVRLREGRIAEIETLPGEVNESFVPDEECNARPFVFHPKHGHLTPHPAMQTPLQRYAAAYLRECMRQHTGYTEPASYDGEEPQPAPLKDGSAYWVKLTRDEPSFCDFAFAYAGRVYAVCARETKVHPSRGGSLRDLVEELPGLEALVHFAEKYNLVPCIFPAERHYALEPDRSWNLWDVRTLQPVTPQENPPVDATPPLSEWEKLCAGLAELARRTVKNGGKVIAFHDTPELYPHFWYRDAEGRLDWVILRTSGGTEEELTAAQKRPLQLFADTKGYVASVEVYGDAGCSTPARRGETTYVRVSPLAALN